MSQEGAEMEVITPEMREPVLSEEEKLAQAQQRFIYPKVLWNSMVLMLYMVMIKN